VKTSNLTVELIHCDVTGPVIKSSVEQQKPQILQQKQTPRPLVRERTIPTDQPPLVDEI
jgi:hypothetical protein